MIRGSINTMGFCKSCGATLADSDVYCDVCGTRQVLRQPAVQCENCAKNKAALEEIKKKVQILLVENFGTEMSKKMLKKYGIEI